MLQMSSPQVSAIFQQMAAIFPHMSAIDLFVKCCKLQRLQELPLHQTWRVCWNAQSWRVCCVVLNQFCTRIVSCCTRCRSRSPKSARRDIWYFFAYKGCCRKVVPNSADQKDPPTTVSGPLKSFLAEFLEVDVSRISIHSVRESLRRRLASLRRLLGTNLDVDYSVRVETPEELTTVVTHMASTEPSRSLVQNSSHHLFAKGSYVLAWTFPGMSILEEEKHF